MKGSLFSIGIDLGTTNSALSFTRVDDDYATSQLFEISQWQTATSQSAQKTLPSFLFLPTDQDCIPSTAPRHSSRGHRKS